MSDTVSENEKEGISDNELINRFKAGDEHAFSLLAERYFWLIRTITSKYRITGFDRDDLIQEGMVGLFSAVKAYDENKEASFKTFASLCISHRIIKLLERSDNVKASGNTFISLDDSSVNAEKLISDHSALNDSDTDPEHSDGDLQIQIPHRPSWPCSHRCNHPVRCHYQQHSHHHGTKPVLGACRYQYLESIHSGKDSPH